MSERCIVVVTRAPRSAQAKTRLAEGVGADASLALQRAFLADTLAWAAALAERRVLAVYPPADAAGLEAAAPGWAIAPQGEEDFGARMRGAVNAGFERGDGPVAMIATDSPTLPPALVRDAWCAVQEGEADVVLGPAADGGWVLIAARAPLPRDCFDGVRWSCAQTLADTEAALLRAGLATARTEPWYDVDTLADLERLRAELREPAQAARAAKTAAALAAL